MSILIKGMEMPKQGRITLQIGADGAVYVIDKCEITAEKYEKNFEAVEVPEWIPVTDKLPEEYKNVLCYYEYLRHGDFNCMFRTIDCGYYSNGIWGGEAGQGYKNKVLAWMPLPEPPKDGEI